MKKKYKYVPHFAAPAAAAAAGVMTFPASAFLTEVNADDPSMASDLMYWTKCLNYPRDGIDSGVDPRKLGSVKFTMTPAEPDDFGGQTSGTVVISSGTGSNVDHNWMEYEYGGAWDDEKKEYTDEGGKPLHIVTEEGYTCSVTLPIDETNCVLDEVYAAPSFYVQVGISEFNDPFDEMTVLSLELFGKSGELLASFDGNGSLTYISDNAAPDTEFVPEPSPAPLPEVIDTAKSSPDTGIADTAAAAGIAIAAAGALIISRRK